MNARYSDLPACPGRPARQRLWGLIAILALLAATAGTPAAQAAYTPEFDVDLVSSRAETAEGTAPRVDLYTAVRYPDLRFLSRTGGFEATYTITIDVHSVDDAGRQEGLVLSRSFERRVTVPTYEGTQAASIDRAVQGVDLPPGRYAVAVSVEDGSSGRTSTREMAYTVRPLGEGVSISDPILVDRYDEATRTFEPNVGAAISTEQDAFAVYYEIHAPAPATLGVTYVVTEQNRVQDRPSFGALLGLAPRQQADLGTPVAHSETLEVPAGTTPAAYRIETADLQVGDYSLTVRLETPDGEVVAEADRLFSVRWMGLDAQIADIEQAISQLRYVARERDVRAMRDASTPQERLRLFQEFWGRRDPTPGTTRNERMEEYYFRVAYANERYSRMRDAGWSTDRGEVYIRYGEPDQVEEHPFNFGTRPYQIWTYYRSGRRFIFIDESGSGDYELLVPIWDDRTRL